MYLILSTLGIVSIVITVTFSQVEITTEDPKLERISGKIKEVFLWVAIFSLALSIIL
jgi:hypothetical protein